MLKTGVAASALIALGLLAGCGKEPAPVAQPSASAAPVEPSASASIAASEPAAPLLKAASYPPRDECKGLPGWADFRTKLEQAVAHRDAETLAGLIDPAIELDFGGGHGVKELRRRLDDKDYKLWDQLTALLPLGCAADESSATMPWIFAKAPEDADPYAGMLVLGDAVPAYAKPDAASPALATLNWPVVTVVDNSGSEQPFTKVTLPDSKIAYVESTKLRSLLDYRLIASRAKQGWRITALIAGD